MKNAPPSTARRRRRAGGLHRFRSPFAGWVQLAVMLLWTLQPLPWCRGYWHDADGDGLPEGQAEPADPADPWWSEDSDGDLMTNSEEVTFGSAPYLLDSDHDGLTDRD